MSPRPAPTEARVDDLTALDIRVARVLTAEPLEGARKPAYRMSVDCGPDLGTRATSAQITEAYAPSELVGRLVLAVVNLPPRRVAGFVSEVLTLGVYADAGGGPVVLVAPDAHPSVQPGDRLG
jgi:tRNA-binding protein